MKEKTHHIVERHIAVFSFNDTRGKFAGIKIKIGDWQEDAPIAFLKVTEIKALEALLNRAFELGRQHASRTDIIATGDNGTGGLAPSRPTGETGDGTDVQG